MSCPELHCASLPLDAVRSPKIPVSVLVVIYSADLQVLLLERADPPGYWQSVTGSQATAGEDLMRTACREVAEETGIRVGSVSVVPQDLVDWRQRQDYAIHPRWRRRFAPGVVSNAEHVFGLKVPADIAITLSAREHVRCVWLPWGQAAAACSSVTNAAAIRQLPLRAAMKVA